MAYVRFMSCSELAAASVNSTITLWRWESMERLQAFSGHVNISNFAGMATTGDYIACGSETSQVRTGLCQACMSTSLYKHTRTMSVDLILQKWLHGAERMRRGPDQRQCICNDFVAELGQLTGFFSAGAYLLQAALQANPHTLSDARKDGCIKQLLHSCHSVESPLCRADRFALDWVMLYSLPVSRK